VIVKNGAGAVTFLEGNGSTGTRSIPPVEQVVDTTAAGDSFNAGFLAAELGGKSIEDSIEAGARLAAKVIGARGALVKGTQDL
jgi:2-dehydro-3-deoxygluconokinase